MKAQLTFALMSGVASIALVASPACAAGQEVPPTPVPSPAASQTNQAAAPTPAASSQGSAIPDIVVTAERREERLQSVPLTVSAVTSQTALNQGVISTIGLQTAVPGLDFSASAGGVTPFIRGVGSTISTPGAEPSVATYIDGVYLPSAVGAVFELNNINRIEVLKGPQGTLFGRNATGGVVQIITKDPSHTPSLDASVGYGNYNTATYNGYATTGLGSNLAVDLAILGDNQHDGWGRNLFTGTPTFTNHNFNVRNKWIWTPGNRTTIDLALDYEYSRAEDGLGLHPAPGTVGLGGFGNPGFYNTNGNLDSVRVTRQGGAALQIAQDLGFGTLKSITSYRRLGGNFVLDQDATPVPAVNAFVENDEHTTSEELQLASNQSSAVKWIAGLFYFHDIAGYTPLRLAGAGPRGSDIAITGIESTDSYAGYAQATITLLSNLHFTGGLRYTDDQRGIAGNTVISGIGQVASGQQSESFKKLTWRFSLDDQFTPAILGYVSYNRGFKSGLFNVTTYAQPAVRPEVLDAYEIGVKSEFFDRRLRVNLSGYYYDYSDLQENELQAGAIIAVNAAKARIYGIDADITAIPVRNLTLSTSFAYIHGRYVSFPNAPFFPGNGTQTSIDASGQDTVHTPSITISLNANYKIVSHVGDFDLAANFYHNSGFIWDPGNALSQPQYNLVNASIGWMNRSGRYGVRLWVRNLNDAHYLGFAAASTLGDDVSPAPPRTFGLTASLHLGIQP